MLEEYGPCRMVEKERVEEGRRREWGLASFQGRFFLSLVVRGMGRRVCGHFRLVRARAVVTWGWVGLGFGGLERSSAYSHSHIHHL